MESKALDFLKSHQSEAPSRFVENAAWRKENASWLRWSRKVALAIYRLYAREWLEASRCRKEVRS